MAQKKISDLTPGAAIAAGHLFETVQSGGSFSVTGAQLQTWAQAGLGTAATKNTGTSGATVPLQNAPSTWSAQVTVSWASPGAAVLTLVNSNGASGDRGIRFAIGPTSPTDTASIYMHFLDAAQTAVYGSISRNTGSAVAYNTTSDRNLKDEIADAPPAWGLDLLEQLRPRSFVFKGDADKLRHVGLIAQEVYETAARHLVSVGGAKIEIEEGDGNEKTTRTIEQPWAINYPGLIPHLLLAVQQLSARVADLERQLKTR